MNPLPEKVLGRVTFWGNPDARKTLILKNLNGVFYGPTVANV
jgi:hypothetical protein